MKDETASRIISAMALVSIVISCISMFSDIRQSREIAALEAMHSATADSLINDVWYVPDHPDSIEVRVYAEYAVSDSGDTIQVRWGHIE